MLSMGSYLPWFSAYFVGDYFGNSLVTCGSSNKIIYCSEMKVGDLMQRATWDAAKNRNGIGINRMWNCGLYKDKKASGVVVRYDTVASPSRMVTLADAAFAGYTQGYFSWSSMTRDVDGAPVDSSGVVQLNTYGTTAYLHVGQCTLGFADGHVGGTRDVLADNANKSLTTVATQ